MRRKYWLGGPTRQHAEPTRSATAVATLVLILILAATGGVTLGWVLSGGLLRLGTTIGALP